MFFQSLVGKRVQIRKPANSVLDTAPERKRSTPINPANTIRKSNISNSIAQRPYRERVIHLLALKPYKKPEILARLHKDGVNLKDKNSLGVILPQVRMVQSDRSNILSCTVNTCFCVGVRSHTHTHTHFSLGLMDDFFLSEFTSMDPVFH